MELFLVLALAVRAASGNTGLLSKQLHLRILLRMRIGFRRNNHHKHLISQIQLILWCWQTSFWLVGLTWLTLLSKEVPTYCWLETHSCNAGPEASTDTQCSGAGTSLKSNSGRSVPWRLPTVILQGPTFKVSRARATAQCGSNLCHEISSNSEHIAVQLGDREELCVPRWTAQRNGTRNKSRAKWFPSLWLSWQANILRSGKAHLYCLEATSGFLLTCHFVLSPVQIGMRQVQTSWRKNGSTEKNYIPMLAMCWSKLNHIYIFESENCIICIIYLSHKKYHEVYLWHEFFRFE